MAERYKLYSYFRSSCSYRVRIALAHKQIPYEYEAVHLLQDGGQQFEEAYKAHNPMAEVPTLEVLDESGTSLASIGQSMAILEYLEECHPTPSLLPKDPIERARVRQLAECVGSDIQPIQNLRVMKHLMATFKVERPAAAAWNHYWIDRGFQGLEKLMAKTAGTYAFGDQVTLADVLLVPQHYNAVRFDVDMAQFPTIERVCQACQALPAFQQAAPECQPDTPADLA